MRSLIILSLAFSLQASAQLLRGVENISLASKIPSSIEMGGAPFVVKFQLENKKGKPSKNKKIDIQVVEGASKVSDISKRSDQDGIISFKFIPSSSEGVTKVKIQYSSILNKVVKEADKITNELIDVDFKDAFDLKDTNGVAHLQEFRVSRGSPSSSKSKAKLLKNEIKQSQNSIALKVEIRNERGALIDLEELPTLSVNGEEIELLKRKKVKDGVFEVSYPRPKGAGSKNLEIDFLGIKSSEKISVIPEIDFRSSRVEVKKTEDDVYTVTPKLIDLDGGPISQAVESSISIGDSKLETVKSAKGFKVIAPEGRGKTKISVKASLNGKSGQISESFEWAYAPYGPENIAASASPEKIAATGFDTSLIRLLIKGKTRPQIESIVEESNLKVIITEGEGHISGFSRKKGKDGLPYLEAEFTAPFNSGESLFAIMDDGQVLVEGLKVSYDVKVGICESENIVDYDTVRVSAFIADNVDLIKKISPGGETKSQGFQIENDGPNDIVPSGWARQFEFEFPDQAKQLMKLQVAHWCNQSDCKVSATNMNSSMYFFPRDEFPRMEVVDDSKIKVTLPTGEDVFFDKKTKKIVGGVLEEGPVDDRQDRFSRTFPDVRYKGKGYVLRVNGRGQQPESGNFSSTPISGEFGHKGGAGAMIYRYNEAQGKTESCNVSKKKLFKKIYKGEPNRDNEMGSAFKFSTDQQFYDFIESNCAFK